LNDTTIFSIVEGSAFHLYAGDVASLSQVHDAFPTKSIHITEQWVSAHGDHEDDILWHGRNVLIGGLSNFAQTILGWNLSSNSALTPHTDGGCSTCLGAVTIDDTVGVRRNTAYYLLAHAAPYLPPGSVRIESTMIDLPFGGDDGPLHHVAFLTPSQHQVVLFTNEATTDYEIALPNGSRITVFGGSLMTIVLDSPRIL
jgi:glucosylceramidase